MRSTRVIWNIVSFIVAIVTVIVILRFFGLTVKDITDNLAEGFGFLSDLLDILRKASLGH